MNINKVHQIVEEHEKHYAHQGTVKFECNADKLYKVLKAVMPLVDSAVALHEFNEDVSSHGYMTPSQEMSKVHLFDDYMKAVETLTGIHVDVD